MNRHFILFLVLAASIAYGVAASGQEAATTAPPSVPAAGQSPAATEQTNKAASATPPASAPEQAAGPAQATPPASQSQTQAPPADQAEASVPASSSGPVAQPVTTPTKEWKTKSSNMDIREGYARPSFVELIRTFVMLKGYDINDIDIADEYGRLAYCSLYYKLYDNDVAWNRTRSEIVSRVLRKKEYYRLKYEIVSPFTLGRYDFKKQFFPVNSPTPIKNVGIIKLLSSAEVQYCKENRRASAFSPYISLKLKTPITVAGFVMPADKVEKVMVRLEEGGNYERQIYGRFRMTVTEAFPLNKTNWQRPSYLKGDIDSVDFFIDEELTKPLGSANLGLHSNSSQ